MDVRNPASDEAEPAPEQTKDVNLTLTITYPVDQEPDALEIQDTMTYTFNEFEDEGRTWQVIEAQVNV